MKHKTVRKITGQVAALLPTYLYLCKAPSPETDDK